MINNLNTNNKKQSAQLRKYENQIEDVPHTIFMLISDAISGKCIFRHISANSAHSSTIKVSNPMF